MVIELGFVCIYRTQDVLCGTLISWQGEAAELSPLPPLNFGTQCQTKRSDVDPFYINVQLQSALVGTIPNLGSTWWARPRIHLLIVSMGIKIEDEWTVISLGPRKCQEAISKRNHGSLYRTRQVDYDAPVT